ncbi:hypothetical protein [Oceanobacillus sp. CAU 1775]
MEIKLKSSKNFEWYSGKGVNIKGSFYWRNHYYEKEKMIAVFDNVKSEKDFVDLINEINGYFAIVIKKNEFVIAATDRINSTPIFFAEGQTLLLSDYADYMPTDKDNIESTSVLEYLSLGYTTGNYTLYADIKQLKPGEYLYYNIDANSLHLNRYYEYKHSVFPYDISEKELVNKLSEVHDEVFKRFTNSLKGRKVIVPLSGGYDSRLIVEMLRKFNYNNVLCITWGKKNDWQVKIAKDVASRLNYEWIRIDHKRKDWYQWFKSEKYSDVNNVTGHISSIPYLQENISIEYLEGKYFIPKDSIFVSGNSGDFIEGEHIPKEILEKDYFTTSEIAELIFKKNHRLFKLKNPTFEKHLKDRIFEVIGTRDDIEAEMAASIFEQWEWQERQSKFVSKSIKAFEVKGYEWRLPLWDSEIMDFWSKVPLEFRYGRKLFLEYSDQYMMKNILKANPNVNKLKIYTERLFDNRYGCFNGNRSLIRSLFITDKKIFNKELLNLVENKFLILHKLNGLLALWNVGSLIADKTNNKNCSLRQLS